MCIFWLIAGRGRGARRYLHVISVDNALSMPCFPALLGECAKNEAEVRRSGLAFRRVDTSNAPWPLAQRIPGWEMGSPASTTNCRRTARPGCQSSQCHSPARAQCQLAPRAAQVANMVVWKERPEEKVGVCAMRDGKLVVVESAGPGVTTLRSVQSSQGRKLSGNHKSGV